MTESMCWDRLRGMLRKNGVSEEAVEVARLAYTAGMHRGFFMLGSLSTTADDMMREWRDFHPVAEADFRDEKKKFLGKRRGEGGARDGH